MRTDAIVNAANSGLTGCFHPNHSCIDNCIHTYAGIQLRLACQKLMEEQGHEEATGLAKITPAFNLPSAYVLHTVGPIVNGRLTAKHKELLSTCHHSCMKLVSQYEIENIAFCCISTGVFGFPQREAAEIAVSTYRRIDGIRYTVYQGEWICSVKELTKWFRTDTAVEILRNKHKNGETYYWLLYYLLLSPQQLKNVDEVIEKLRPYIRNISYRTYY